MDLTPWQLESLFAAVWVRDMERLRRNNAELREALDRSNEQLETERKAIIDSERRHRPSDEKWMTGWVESLLKMGDKLPEE